MAASWELPEYNIDWCGAALLAPETLAVIVRSYELQLVVKRLRPPRDSLPPVPREAAADDRLVTRPA